MVAHKVTPFYWIFKKTMAEILSKALQKNPNAHYKHSDYYYSLTSDYPFSALIFSVKAGITWNASPTTP